MPKPEYKWFIPGEGISREVIQADICRYLGNDALVKPGYGTGEHEGVYGYWIAAYRALTTEMIADLKADSARWSQEQARSRDPRVAYQDSQVHQSRQYWGPTSSAPAQSGQTTTSSGYTAPQGASSYQVSSSGHGYSSPSYPPGGSSGRQSQYPPSSGSYHQSPAYTTSTSSPPASYPAQVSYPAYHQGEGQQDPYAATPGYQGYAQQPYQPADPRNPQNPYGYPPRDGSASGTSQAGAYPYSQTGGYPPSQRAGHQPAPGYDQYGRQINPNPYGR